jgi:hypothetical protein
MPFTDNEELITEAEVSEYTKRSRRQLQRDRAARRGIPFVLFETQVRYRLGDVRSYVASRLVDCTLESRTDRRMNSNRSSQAAEGRA